MPSRYIDKCSAPCIGRIEADAHRDLINGFSALVDGDTRPVVRRLTTDMQQASDDLDFERAARLRDDIAAVESVAQKSAVVLPTDQDVDVIATHEDELAASVQVFHIRDGRVRGERGFVTDKQDDANSGDIMLRVLQQLYADDGGEIPPREIVVSVDPSDVAVAQEWLSQRRGSAVEVRVPQRGPKRLVMETVARNAEQALSLYRTRRGADIASRGKALQEIADYLDLASAPLRIECIDVSHLDGTNVVASLVVFEDGLPSKADYRRFVIKHGQGKRRRAKCCGSGVATIQTRRSRDGRDEAEVRLSAAAVGHRWRQTAGQRGRGCTGDGRRDHPGSRTCQATRRVVASRCIRSHHHAAQ